MFVDDCRYPFQDQEYERFGCEVTNRSPGIGAWGNWALGLLELRIRFPVAKRYAIFQDDLVCVRGLRDYLDRFRPEHGYLNLYTVQQNADQRPEGFEHGWYLSNQMGRGALALVLPHDAVDALLSDPAFARKAQDCGHPASKIDGTVAGCLKRAGWLEYVHYPSLVEHTGVKRSEIGHDVGAYRMAPSFPGEETDASVWAILG
ncbi:MAG: hypothetical protein KKH61_20740 [Gammaproteobacteria bacterium]|nr:hypothetical protein [Gammaproteobacteria bacterium]